MTQQIALVADALGAAAAADQQNLRTVAHQIDAISRGDLDAVLEHAQPDVQFEVFAPPEFKWIRRASGAVALQEAIHHNFGSLIDQAPEITSVTAQGDTVILLGRERGRIKETGAEYAVEFVQRFQFREGRLAAVKIIAARAG